MRKSALILALVVSACSAQQQQQAQQNVQNIQTNPDVRKAGRNVSDAALSAAVEAAIAGQAGLNVFHIGATARSGVVTLTGTVRSAAIAQTALTTARNVRGVTRVVDQLRIR